MDKKILQTPSQTIGPYFAYGLTPEQYHYNNTSIVDNELYKTTYIDRERILIKGRVLDANGEAISDAIIEIRQDASIEGFGRMGTGTASDHSFVFHTIKPERIADRPPHINVVVMMRGLLSHVFTRIYFSDENNSSDPLLAKVSEDRQKTLIAQRKKVNGQIIYEFNICMQGENETLFFDA